MPEWFLDISAWVLPLVLAVTLHEAAHGWMAERFGDDTARLAGRVTFNPIRHVDKYGTIVFPGLLMLMQSPILFGYAKPVPVDFGRLNPPRLGMFMVAFAGPGINILLAIAGGIALHMETFITPEEAPWLYLNLYRFIMLNCVLAVFNLLPILPLDGGRIVDSFLRGSARAAFRRFERYGIVLVLALLLIPALIGYPLAEIIIGTPALGLMQALLVLTGNGS